MKKFLCSRFCVFLLFLIIFLSVALSAFANASNLNLKNDNNRALKSALVLNKYIIPYSELTLKNISLLPGRYAVIKNIPTVDPKSDKTIAAASNEILKISKLNKKGFYNFEYDSFLDGRNDNKKISKITMKLETKDNVPIIFEIKNNKKSREGKYIALRFYEDKFLWTVLDSRTQEITYLQPLNNDWLPSGFLNGEWKEKISGSTFLFTNENMQLFTNGKEFSGNYILDNNRMYFEFPNGDVGLYYVAFNPDTQILSLTKIAGDGLLRAMNLERTGEAAVQTQSPKIAEQKQITPEQNSTPRRQRRSNEQYESDYAKLTTAADKSKVKVIETPEQASQPKTTQSPKPDFEKFGKNLIATAVKSQASGSSKEERKDRLIRETTNLVYQDVIAPNLEQDQQQNDNNNEETTTISESASQYVSKLPDSEPEDEYEYEAFSGTYEYRGNGESVVIRFKDNGQFTEESKTESSGTAKEQSGISTGTYSVKGNIITLHHKNFSMNGGMTVETNGNTTLIIDRKNNILLDDIDSPNFIYRGATVPIWKRKPQAAKPKSVSKSTESISPQITPAPEPQEPDEPEPISAPQEVQPKESKPADDMFPGYYADEEYVFFFNDYENRFTVLDSSARTVLVGKYSVNGNNLTLNGYTPDGQYNPMNPLIIEMTVNRKNQTLKSSKGSVLRRVASIQEFMMKKMRY